MAYLNLKNNKRGFSLLEVIIVSAIITLFFGELFGGIHYTLSLITNSKAKLTALSVANDAMEYIHSLTYDAVGTVAGIPSGLIPQVSTSTLNGIEFEKRVLVEYVDSPADGLGQADSNGITTDYKQVKVTVGWVSGGQAKQIFLVSLIIPRSIESDVGGGTLRVNVFDANIIPLPGASVRVINNTLSPHIDITRTTDASGIALFSGAPAGADYEIFVTASGYSSEQTYMATVDLPNPTSRPVAVLEADVSTMNFFIDRLSTLDITTLADKTNQIVSEQFNDLSGVATSSAVTANAGSLVLTDVAGSYSPSGEAFLASTSPAILQQWDKVEMTSVVPADTTLILQLYTGTSTYILVPDSALPGNGVGFSSSPVDISGLDVATYPSLVIGVQLATTNSTITPAVDTIVIQYVESETPLGSVSLISLGAKTIGTDASSSPVYKTELTGTSNGSGKLIFSDVEYDSYTISATGYDIREACQANPVKVFPNTNTELSLILGSNTVNSLRVVAKTSLGTKLSDATVTLSRPGFSASGITSPCGQVYFGSLTSADDYELLVEAIGYVSQTMGSTTVSGDTVKTVTF